MLCSFWRPSVVFTTLFVSWFYDGNECRTSLSPSRSAMLAPYLFSAYTQFTHATTTTTVCLMPLASSAFVLAFSRSAINLPLVYIGLYCMLALAIQCHVVRVFVIMHCIKIRMQWKGNHCMHETDGHKFLALRRHICRNLGRSKIASFACLTSYIWHLRLGWTQRNFIKCFGVRKLSILYRLLCDVGCLMIGSIPACDGRTDGQNCYSAPWARIVCT